MSRLDSIISFVDELDSRSDRLLDSVDASNHIISSIMRSNEEASRLDASIDEIQDIMDINLRSMGEFSNLYEKSFYLESNMYGNDKITNQTSFETLTEEFRYLVKKLEKNDKYSGVRGKSPFKPRPEPKPATAELLPSPLSSKSSLSNLKLKPIRCNSKRVYKKKSKYRLSGLFNINPIAYEDEVSIATQTPKSTRDLDLNLVTSSEATSIASNIMDNIDTRYIPDGKAEKEDTHTCASTPTQEYLGLRGRSNSLPETPASSTLFSKSGVMKNSNILSEFDTEIGAEKLRFNRLKHFITYGNLNPGSDRIKDLDYEFSKSPTRPVVTSVNLDDHTDFDNLSIVSDVSCYSPERNEDFDNFDKFLRGSRFDLNNAFPHILNKSTSQDSIFQAYTVFTEPEKPAYKFHNPAANIHSSSSYVATPTIEQIHFNHPKPTEKKVRFSFNEDPKKLLNDVIQRNEQSTKTAPSPESSPSRSKGFSLFNFTLNSPSKPIPDTSTQGERRGSIDNISRSLTDSFLSLVNPSLKAPPTPEKIKVMKIQAKEVKPIRIKSDGQVKRMPIRIPRNDGGHSRLTLGPNHTRVINHGESSVFRKPVMTRISHNSLREALSASLN